MNENDNDHDDDNDRCSPLQPQAVLQRDKKVKVQDRMVTKNVTVQHVTIVRYVAAASVGLHVDMTAHVSRLINGDVTVHALGSMHPRGNSSVLNEQLHIPV